MPVIIDGYNLLWAVQKLGEESGPVSDVQLCQIISGYLRLIDSDGEIIFDGTGPRDKRGFDNISNLEVFFSGADSDADTVIENKIKASSSPRRLTIVSSDRRLRKAAWARKSTAVKSEVFWNNMCKQLSRKKTAREPSAKRRRLSESETEYWFKFFGFKE
jgi:uncharacterized protein